MQPFHHPEEARNVRMIDIQMTSVEKRLQAAEEDRVMVESKAKLLRLEKEKQVTRELELRHRADHLKRELEISDLRMNSLRVRCAVAQERNSKQDMLVKQAEHERLMSERKRDIYFIQVMKPVEEKLIGIVRMMKGRAPGESAAHCWPMFAEVQELAMKAQDLEQSNVQLLKQESGLKEKAENATDKLKTMLGSHIMSGFIRLRNECRDITLEIDNGFAEMEHQRERMLNYLKTQAEDPETERVQLPRFNDDDTSHEFFPDEEEQQIEMSKIETIECIKCHNKTIVRFGEMEDSMHMAIESTPVKFTSFEMVVNALLTYGKHV